VSPILSHPNKKINQERRYLKKTVLEEMAIAQEVEKILIRRGKLHEDGTRDLSLTSKIHGKTDMKSDFKMPTSNIWQWRLTPDYETKIDNYPEPPIAKILWKPGEKEARKEAHAAEKREKLAKKTRELHVPAPVKATRANAPDFPAVNA